MKKSIQIQIPEPCHENWDKMTAANQGRFCNACSKVVVDFSMMSDKEILNHLSKASSSICGRVHNDQMNRPIQMPIERRQISFKYFWSLLISSFLIGSKANAQGKVRVDTITNITPEIVGDTEIVVGGVLGISDDEQVFFPGRKLIKGQVTDESGMPIASASVKIENSKFGKVADSKGRFKFKIPSNFNDIKITVSSIGYETITIDLDDEITQPLNIAMKSSHTELLSGVIVVGYQTRVCRSTTGLMMVTRSENRFIDTLRQIFSKNDIKIYPNPVKPGTAFNISFNVVETGSYKLELYDATGRMMQTSTIAIPSNKFVMNFGSNLSLTSGIYFVKILSAKGKNVYSGSLLVQ